MPRARTPVAKAKATGADVANPKRHAARSNPKAVPLGAPTAFLTPDQRKVWTAFKREMPWLAESDRAVVETACCLRARLWSGEEVGVQALAQLRMCLSAMGGTPADRSKVMVPDDEGEADPAAGYFN